MSDGRDAMTMGRGHRHEAGTAPDALSRPGNGPVQAQIVNHLFDRPPPPGYREEWTRLLARPVDDAIDQAELDSTLVFRLGEEWLGLPASICHEIAEPRPVHSLPHRRSGAVLGIVNVRGELLVCVSLADLLGIDTQSSPGSAGRIAVFRRLVVVGEGSRRVAFEADEVHGLHSHGTRDRSPVPATIGRAAASVAATMVAWNDRVVGCLDAARLLALIDRSIA